MSKEEKKEAEVEMEKKEEKEEEEPKVSHVTCPDGHVLPPPSEFVS